MTKLSIHSQIDSLPLHSLLSIIRPRYVKCIDPSLDYAIFLASLGIRLVVRHNYPQWNDLADAISFTRSCESQPWFPYAWAIETLNEPFSGTPDVPDWFIEAEHTVAQIFANVHKHTIVGNRAVGHDGYYVPPTSPYHHPTDQLPYRLFGSQAYWWEPNFHLTDPYRALRHERWFPDRVLKYDPSARLFLTEFGMTHALVEGYPDVGWKMSSSSPSEVWNQVLQFMSIINATHYIESAFFFQFGGLPDHRSSTPWSSFEGLGSPLEPLLIQHYQEEHQMPTLPPYPQRQYRFRQYQPVTQPFGEDLRNPDGSPVYLLNYLESGNQIIQTNLHWGCDYGKRLDQGSMHGVDVLADIDGIVYRAGEKFPNDPRGIHVIIDHADKVHYSLAGHLSEVLVAVGDHVQAGQVIGRVGSTGVSNAPHLHDAVGAFIGGTTYWRDPQITLDFPTSGIDHTIIQTYQSGKQRLDGLVDVYNQLGRALS